jgi:hypothetical protein|tara:strand:+ start:518 stop:796 length:279 start_codon:yes stop_codon:yes gene_type:complete
MADLHKAIYNIHTNVKSIDGDTQETITAWDENKNLVTIDWTQVNAWVDPNQYKYDRANSYPSIKDQLDDIYHNGIDGWKSTIKITKDKYPKG